MYSRAVWKDFKSLTLWMPFKRRHNILKNAPAHKKHVKEINWNWGNGKGAKTVSS